MSKTLIIAEKPSVARELAAAIGGFKKADNWLESDTAVISNALGHLVRLEMPLAAVSGKDLATLPVMGDFETQLIDDRGSKAQYRVLESLMKRADIGMVVNACDAGREGELIFRLIYEHAKCRKPMQRMWIQSLTKDGLSEAHRTMRPGSEFDNLYAAARSRSEADFLVGINGSRAVTKMRDESSSTGRVQTPTLAMVVARELAIINFKPIDYWEVHATFGASAGQYVGKWFDAGTAKPLSTSEEGEEGEETTAGQRFFDRSKADLIVAKCRSVDPSSVTDTAKRTKRVAPRLYHLTSLQQDANRRFKFSAKKTLEIAQDLYEKHKVTTYPRTDADALPEDYVEKVKELMAFLESTAYGVHAKRVLDNGWVKPTKQIFNNAEISDHFAIIITEVRPSGLSQDEQLIYDLIATRFVTAFHPAAEYDVTTRVSVVAGESFKSTGRVLVSKGWLEVSGAQEGADNKKSPALCALTPGEAVKTLKVESVTLQTRPPSRYNEATLLKAMETAGKDIADKEQRDAMKGRGLGTPATRADTIEGLLSKGSRDRPRQPYMVRSTRDKEVELVPTEKAMSIVADLQKEDLGLLTSAEMTGEWEQKLGLIAQGKLDRSAFMEGIKAQVQDLVNKIRNKAGSTPSAQAKPLAVPCPKCGQALGASTRTVDCSAGCGFKVWREAYGRALTDAELAAIIKNGVLEGLEFISSKTKRSYTANLKFADFKIQMEFVDRAATDKAALPSLDVPCPKCRGVIRVHGGDFAKYACETGDFTLWKTVAERPLTDAEAKQLLKNRELPAVQGFVSRKAKPAKKFAAGLRLRADLSGGVEFIFESR